MKTLLPKRTALARAVLSSLTGEVVPVERNGRAFSRLLIQVLPALAVAGLFSSHAFAADPYIDLDTGRWIGDYEFHGDGHVAGSYAYHRWGADRQWSSGELLDYVNHNNIYGWKDIKGEPVYDFFYQPVTITVRVATVLDVAGIKIDGTSVGRAASGSTVVLRDNSHASNVYGGYNNSREANDNTVRILDSYVEDSVIAGYTGAAGATASGNTVYIEHSTVKVRVAGGYSSSSGDAIGNTLTVVGSDCGGFVYGGYSSSGDASYNKVYYTDTSSHVNGGRSDSGNANYNEVYYSGSSLSVVYGGLAGGAAIGNILSVTGSQVYGWSYAGYSNGGGEVADNQFILDGVYTSFGTDVYLYAGESTGGTVHGNSITLKGESNVNLRNVYIYGGHTSGDGIAYGNTATIDNSYINGDVAGAVTSNGAAYENTVTITNGATVQGVIYGATGNTSVYSNVVTISDKSTIHSVYGGYSGQDASITGNYVTLSGAVDANGSIYGGASTSSSATKEVSGNYVNFSGNTTVTFSSLQSIYGGYSAATAVSGNYVRISGITVALTGMDSIYGGRTASAAAASNNYVEVSGSSTLTTDAGVYGGSGDSGTVSGNHVSVFGGSSMSTSLNVYGGYSMDGTASQNYVQISDSSKMTAEYGIYGGYSVSGTADGNYVRISSGSTVDSTNGIYGGYSDSGTVSKNYVSVFGNNTSTVNGDLYGGYSSSGTASDNYVAVFSGSTLDITGDTIYGGYTVSGTASDNYIQITGTVTTADQDLKIYGGYASESGKVSGNHIDISGSSTTLAGRGGYSENYYYGGYTPGSGDVTDNYISISGSSISISARSDIYGGYTTGAGAVSGNNVIISGDSISLSGRTFIYGASSRGAGTVSDNYVEISGKNLSISLSSDIYGAYSNGGGDVSGNHVEISANSMSIDNTLTVYGAYSFGVGTVSGNSVTISGQATITSKDSKIYGGYSNSSGNVSGNTVNISAAIDGTVDIYGGYSGWGAISNNTVNLNSTVSGNVYAGYGANNGRVNDNIVNVNGSSLDLSKATLYGRNDSTSGSGNTLNLNGYSGTIQNIVNFDAINIDLSGVDLESGQAVVTLAAGSTDISNSTITVTSTTSAGSEAVATTSSALADSYTLLTNANGNLTVDGATASGTITVVQDSVLYMEYSLYIDEYSGSVLAVSPSYFGGYGDGDGSSGVKVTPAANILPEQHLAVASFLNTATDFVLDRKIECSANDNGSVGTCFFGAMSGGELRQKLHGGSAATREDGTHFFLGVRTKFNNDTSKDIIGALWAEAGWGTVKANNSYAGSRGHDSYYGLGILGEHRQKEGALAGAYAQVFAHAGSAGYDIKTSLGSGSSKVSYDKNSMYVGAGIQLGYEFPFNESLSLDTSINYRWLHLEGFKTTSNSIKYKVKDVDSHRTRVGTRLSYGKDKAVSNVYAGVAWEQEYSGKAKGTVNGLSISDPTSLKGSSAVIEAGVKFKPSKKSRWSFNGSVEGYVGKREGVLGNVVVNYTF